MKCNVYKSQNSSNRHLILPEGSDLSKLPNEIQEEFAGSSPWRQAEVQSGKPLIAMDPDEALSNIEQQGYHIQETKILFNEIT